MRFIPPEELEINFARSSGAGGQNVNKVETKVLLFWDFKKSEILTLEEKEKIALKLRSRINKEDKLCLAVENTRSQQRNRELALERLNKLVDQALQVERKRIKTKAPRKAKEKRLEDKRRQSQKKAQRKVDRLID